MSIRIFNEVFIAPGILDLNIGHLVDICRRTMVYLLIHTASMHLRAFCVPANRWKTTGPGLTSEEGIQNRGVDREDGDQLLEIVSFCHGRANPRQTRSLTSSRIAQMELWLMVLGE